MTIRRGLTILELLLSLAILSAMVALAGTWLVGAARASVDESRRAWRQLTLHRAALVLQRDVDEAADNSVEIVEHDNAARSIRMVTSHHPGRSEGDERGWAVVTWTLQPVSGHLIRATAPVSDQDRPPVERRVLHGPVGLMINADQTIESSPGRGMVTVIIERGGTAARASVTGRRLRQRGAAL